MKKSLRCILAALAAGMLLGLSACENAVEETTEPVESVGNGGTIQSVTAIAFADVDGPKLQAVAVEYDCDMTGAELAEDTYELSVYSMMELEYKGDGELGDVTAVYVNDEPAVSAAGGSGSGRYVIVELFTDWRAATQMGFPNCLNAKVTQVKDIACDAGTIPADSGTSYGTMSGGGKKSVKFAMPDIKGFRYYTDDAGDYGSDGGAFVWENCFSMIDGSYTDEHLAYALFLPEDYHEDGSYAMVTVDNPATAKGTHPLISVLATRSPALLASDWAQEQVKEQHGLDGLIVLVPVITERVDDNGGTPAEYQALVHLWDNIIETYHVDPDYVYGVGQSVGGMELLETNRNRDNFFAGLILYEDQWGQNYYMDTTFERDMAANPATEAAAPMHYPRVDGTITWDYHYDASGEPVYEGHDPYNYFYLISDDNILVLHADENYSSGNAWIELEYLYRDLAGCDVTELELDSTLDVDSQNSALREYFDRGEALNINIVSLINGDNGYSCRKPEATYQWLLSQSRQTAMTRKKLDLNKPFAMAAEQLQTEDRALHFTGRDGETIYYLTGKAGAGTQFYNTSWLNMATITDALPGWLPEGMSWETGVSGAHIVGVSALGDNALAVEYDTDMTGAVIHLKGDKVVSYFGNEREDGEILLDPYVLCGADGAELACEIKNIYVNNAPATVDGEERLSGTGRYVIVELSGTIPSGAAGIIQRTTIRTDRVISSALSTVYFIAGAN